MIADQQKQTRLLMQLREARLAGANRALAAARTAAEAAEAERCVAEIAACHADARLDGHRHGLATDPCDAPMQLALIQHSLFQQAVARSASNDAVETVRLCEVAEREQRRAMILARARRDCVADQARALAMRAAEAREEQSAIEAEDARRRG